jgi:glutamate synthase domain-containing protein 3
MHGGRIFIRTTKDLLSLPAQVTLTNAAAEDLNEIKPYVSEFSGYFGMDTDSLLKDNFYLLKPNARNPYKQLYTAN